MFAFPLLKKKYRKASTETQRLLSIVPRIKISGTMALSQPMQNKEVRHEDIAVLLLIGINSRTYNWEGVNSMGPPMLVKKYKKIVGNLPIIGINKSTYIVSQRTWNPLDLQMNSRLNTNSEKMLRAISCRSNFMLATSVSLVH